MLSFPAMNALLPLLDRAAYAAWVDPPLWGMLHLAPLPGSPAWSGRAAEAEERALKDAEGLVEAGFRALVVENYGDLPFFPDRVPPITVAAMSRVLGRVRAEWPELRLAVNCLRNDAESAMAMACAHEADAIRVNVHTGAALTDQGILSGRAADTLRRRREWGGEGVRLLADLRVKHAVPVAPRPLEEELFDLRERGRADVILVTGGGTGEAADPAQAEFVRSALPDAPLVVASGVRVETAAQWARSVDGGIVGSDLMVGGRAGAGVDPERARRLLEAWMGA